MPKTENTHFVVIEIDDSIDNSQTILRAISRMNQSHEIFLYLDPSRTILSYRTVPGPIREAIY